MGVSEVVFFEAQLFEHRVERARLEFRLGVADHGACITKTQDAVGTLAEIRSSGKRDAVPRGIAVDFTDELVAAHVNYRSLMSG